MLADTELLPPVKGDACGNGNRRRSRPTATLQRIQRQSSVKPLSCTTLTPKHTRSHGTSKASVDHGGQGGSAARALSLAMAVQDSARSLAMAMAVFCCPLKAHFWAILYHLFITVASPWWGREHSPSQKALAKANAPPTLRSNQLLRTDATVYPVFQCIRTCSKVRLL